MCLIIFLGYIPLMASDYIVHFLLQFLLLIILYALSLPF